MTMRDPLTPTDALGRANPRVAPDAVWDQVRQDYLSGIPAAEACRRHGVGLTAMRNRAARENWRRSDLDWTAPDRLDPEDEGRRLEEALCGDLDRVELEDLAHVADRRMMRAILRGHAAEALRWRRVRQALEEDDVELHRRLASDEALSDRLYADAALSPADSVDRAHPVIQPRD